VFFIRKNKEKFNLACYCSSNLVFEYVDYIHSFASISFATSAIVKKQSSSLNIEEVDKYFAEAILPRAINFVESELVPRNFSGRIKDIERVTWYMDMLEQFGSWQDKLGYTAKIAILKVKQNKILRSIKHEHEASLINKIQEILFANDLAKIRKLDKIYSLRKQIYSIQSEALEDYQKVNTSLSELQNALEERERFIKDTLISKYFVFDTNIFLSDPHILSKVKYLDYVILAARVTEELNKHKVNKDQNIAKNAQMAIKLIGNERRKENGHLIFERAKLDLLPNEFSKRDADNMILAVALNHQKENICLVTSDEGLLQKSLQVEIPCLSLDEFYSFIEKREIERKKDIEESKRNQQTQNNKNRK
jgi:rRNA-processing protein FCF1